MEVKRTERGWAGHFCCAKDCSFRRNTLLEYADIKIVVSSVGLMRFPGKTKPEEIGYNRYYETMAFHSDYSDSRYFDADVSRQISFKSEWAISSMDADDEANIMHENVVNEIIEELKAGNQFKEIDE